jgi:nucleoside-diphosphate-sugar epimerase
MRVFVTGATGFIGSAIVPELIKAGHRVLGLARSEAAAKSLAVAGAEVHRGHVEDLDSLRSGVAVSDGVIHTAFIHDFARFKEVCEIDRRAIETLGSAVAGSDRRVVIASGTALVSPGRLATENDAAPSGPDSFPRVASEKAATAAAARGARVSSVRLAPTVHGEGDHGFIPTLIGIAREKRVSAYVGEGKNRWNAVHRLDAASLFRLALEKGEAGARYHAVGEEGVAFREIAEAIGTGLGVPVVSMSPEEATKHFGFFGAFAALDCPCSSKLTRERLGWRAVQPTLLADLAPQGSYFRA